MGSKDYQLKVGIVGLGNISGQYLNNLPKYENLKIVAISDIDQEKSKIIATKFGHKSLTVDEIMNSEEIECILNLTTPQSHEIICKEALMKNKHVYVEKPLTLSTGSATNLLNLTKKSNLRLGCAPDTFLGTGIQTSKFVIDSGEIGSPIAANMFWSAPGHEIWHPNPEFYYQPGAGPLFDIGPYYLTTAVVLMGAVIEVSAMNLVSNRKRYIKVGDFAGKKIEINEKTHYVALLRHKSGAISNITVSFDIWTSKNSKFEIYGESGSLLVPDPNEFTNDVYVFREQSQEWNIIPPKAGITDAGRGVGLMDMSHSIFKEIEHRTSEQLSFHVLDIMESITLAATSNQVIKIDSDFKQPELVPLGGKF